MLPVPFAKDNALIFQSNLNFGCMFVGLAQSTSMTDPRSPKQPKPEQTAAANQIMPLNLSEYV